MELKTKYKFIHFKKVEDDYSKKPYYYCYNTKWGDELGCVEYDDGWKMYTFNPEPMIMLSVSCMQDIIHFIGQLK